MAELRSRQRIVSVAALRDELRRQYGIRAGTQRVYRIVRAAAANPVAKLPPIADSTSQVFDSAVEISRLIAERDAALTRAELAELREVATQDRTANEIWELRQEVKRLKVFRT